MEVLKIKFKNWYFEKLFENRFFFFFKLSPKVKELRVCPLAYGSNTVVGGHACSITSIYILHAVSNSNQACGTLLAFNIPDFISPQVHSYSQLYLLSQIQ